MFPFRPLNLGSIHYLFFLSYFLLNLPGPLVLQPRYLYLCTFFFTKFFMSLLIYV